MKLLKSVLNVVMDSLETIVFVGSIYMVVYIFLFQPGKVQGASMEPTLHTNERFITDKVTYKVHPPERGDIVVIHSPANHEVDLIKRVVGLPGEEVLLRGGEVYINKVKFKEPYAQSPTYMFGMAETEEYQVVVPEESVFVMGDNRSRSSDSRVFGPIPYSSIVGKASYRYAPADKIGKLSP